MKRSVAVVVSVTVAVAVEVEKVPMISFVSILNAIQICVQNTSMTHIDYVKSLLIV